MPTLARPFASQLARISISLAALSALGLAGCTQQDKISEEESATLIAPVAKLELAGATAGGGGASLRTGEQVVQQVCAACHGAGVAGAPKIGDKAAWGPRIAQGFDALLKSAINGKGGMPPKGGAADIPDIELARAVTYLANQGGASFKEPAAPATAADTTAAAGDAGGTPKLYESTCAACHSSGVAGAPKVGDKAAWSARIAQGKDALYHSALAGKGAMPPKGGSSASDDEVKATVDYMIAQSK